MEKVRQKPGGGRHVCVPAVGATEVDGWTLSRCGPDGVPWLLAQYHMPDNTSQLCLINLTTGPAMCSLSQAGGCPQPQMMMISVMKWESQRTPAKEQDLEVAGQEHSAEPGLAGTQQERKATQQPITVITADNSCKLGGRLCSGSPAWCRCATPASIAAVTHA